MAWELAQVNVARLVAPIDGPELAGFRRASPRVGLAASAAPGFRWQLGEGEPAVSPEFAGETGGHGFVVNVSVWDSVESLRAFTYEHPRHAAALRKRRSWFAPGGPSDVALWWVPAGERPTLVEAEERLRHLREHGPTPAVFSVRTVFPPATS